jgi:hypothetical protein
MLAYADMAFGRIERPQQTRPPMPVYHDDLKELVAQLHEASLEQAEDHRPQWSALSLKAADTLEAIAGSSRPGHTVRSTSPWARFRRWLWWVLNPAGPR